MRMLHRIRRLLDTRILIGLYLQGSGFITQRSVASHGSEIEDTATGIKYAVCKSKIDIYYIEWQ
jgi:hypothetical protein